MGGSGHANEMLADVGQTKMTGKIHILIDMDPLNDSPELLGTWTRCG